MSNYKTANMNNDLKSTIINLISKSLDINNVPQAPNAITIEVTEEMIEIDSLLEDKYIILWKNTEANNVNGIGGQAAPIDKRHGSTRWAEAFLAEFGGKLVS